MGETGHGHKAVFYRCGHLKAQCRCMSPKARVDLPTDCPDCQSSRRPAMKDEWWISGPPERFEVGMVVEADLDHGVEHRYFHSQEDADAASLVPWRITRHCPMMPVKEAEEMARSAWDNAYRQGILVAGGDETAPPMSYEDWKKWADTEWRERRAGDA